MAPSLTLYQGKKVLVTGHTGFKGSWLSIWLKSLNADVIGYSLAPPTTPNNFEVTRLEKHLTHIIGDVRDEKHLLHVVQEHQPEIIFHLAAQPLVLDSYDHPKETFDTNVGGTVNLLEAARLTPTTKAVVTITTDKCYENKEWLWGYRENDRLGGSDPYSSSKAMAEMAVTSYRASFCQKKQLLLATARAGNVIGGGDFAANRLLPDVMRALMLDQPIEVRNPASVRPWLHVLEPLYGYLLLGSHLLHGNASYAEAWNFGPREHQAVTVQKMVEKAIALWGTGSWKNSEQPTGRKEMTLLRLNWDKAAELIPWAPRFSWEMAIAETITWFQAYSRSDDMFKICRDQIDRYSHALKETVPS